MNQYDVVYTLIRILTHPLRWLPYRWIHALGKIVGACLFYCMPSYRKRALSNIALAEGIAQSEEEVIDTAKQAFHNLAINCLEYAKFAAEKSFSNVIACENPEVADALYAEGKGLIFFCAHQSNWEALFLDGTRRMKGVAIGKDISNKPLYAWITRIREKHGGKIIAPKQALREGLRALRSGAFLGIVGDQGMPESSYSFPFLGRQAWSSTAPALLAYRTGRPILFAETRRVQGGYRIRYSDPIWPHLEKPMESEVIRMMNAALQLLETSIRKSPGEWLWQHNRWKQQTPRVVYKPFRHDALAIVLPPEPERLRSLLPQLTAFREIYPRGFLAVMAPEHAHEPLPIAVDELIEYKNLEETLRPDMRFKLVFDLAGYSPLRRHYLKRSAFAVLDVPALERLASMHLRGGEQFGDVLKRALCRPGTLWHKEN